MKDDKPLLDQWRQGDLILTPLELPIMAHDNDGPTFEAALPVGAAVLTQSCDIIRSHEDKPYIQIAALAKAGDAELMRAKTGANVRYGYLETLAERGLVVDFDVSATVDKETVALWERTPGCRDDDERRAFARAIARQRERFAFPDNFNDLIKPFRRWLESKRSVDSGYGRFVRAVREIRAFCDDWDAPKLLTFLFMVDAGPATDDEKAWGEALTTLRGKAKHDAYPTPVCRWLTYDDISAREYLATSRLDLDGLSDA